MPDPDPQPTAAATSNPPSSLPSVGTLTDVPGASGSGSSGTAVQFGIYTVLQEIGRGGMGVVYRAEDPHLRRDVALKVMLPDFAANPQAKARFVREARDQAKVEHDHVAAIFHVGEQNGLPFLVMPVLKGLTLHTALRGNPRPPLPEVIRIGGEIAEGLAAAHEQGLVHRDIKPANIWLEGKKLRVKVLDFGLARATTESDTTVRGSDSGAEVDETVTRLGTVVGTPAYMSPEQSLAEPVDGRTDLWSLGVILYQMTTGELPFPGANASAIMAVIKVASPPPPVERNPSVPPVLSDLVLRLLAKEANERPASAEDVAEELRLIEAGLVNAVRMIPLGSSPQVVLPGAEPDPFAEIDATEVSEVPKVAERPDRQRSPLIWVYAVAAVVVAMIVLVLALPPRDRSRTPVVREDPLAKTQPKPQPAPKPKPAEFKPPGPTDFLEVHGVTYQALDDWQRGLRERGFRPTHLSVRGGTPELVFDAVARPETRPWHLEVVTDGPGNRINERYFKNIEDGNNPAIQFAYETPDGSTLLTVWVEKGPKDRRQFAAIRPLKATKTGKGLDEYIDYAQKHGQVPVHVSSVRTGGKAPYGSTSVVEVPGVKWAAELNLVPDDLLQKVAGCREKGWRPRCLVAVCDPKAVRFSAVFGENPEDLAWDFRHGLTTARYGELLAEMRARREWPGAVVSYVEHGEVRYAVVRESEPTAPAGDAAGGVIEPAKKP